VRTGLNARPAEGPAETIRHRAPRDRVVIEVLFLVAWAEMEDAFVGLRDVEVLAVSSLPAAERDHSSAHSSVDEAIGRAIMRSSREPCGDRNNKQNPRCIPPGQARRTGSGRSASPIPMRGLFALLRCPRASLNPPCRRRP